MAMTDREAYELAEMITKTWPNGPKQGAWSSMLQERCERAPAWHTYRLHRDSDERPPTIAGFLSTYRHQLGTAPEPDAVAPPDDGPVMSFAEYLERLRWRAGTGDAEAIEMLDVWERNLQRGLVFGR